MLIWKRMALRNPRFLQNRWVLAASMFLAFTGLSLGLAWISTGYSGVPGWTSFFFLLLIGAGLLFAGWKALRADSRLEVPAWLVWLALGAGILRLLTGAFWFVSLPQGGYGSPVEQGGYVMSDAYARDQAAWNLAESGKPLWVAFTGYRQADQYGGLLYLSGLVYRYLGGDFHQPLLIVVLAAFFSALAVLFTWGFASRAWDSTIGRFSAWSLALYPEAVLLGSSQMREAFTITLVAVAFYGLIRYWQDRTWQGLAWLLLALVFCVPFSPPFAALLLGVLILQALFMGGWKLYRLKNFWLVIAGLALLAGIGVWLSWSRTGGHDFSNPLELASWWIKQSARWQAQLTKQASGWVQKVFQSTPNWIHMPFLVTYGVVRPFLPAALLDSSNPIWQGISIWRSLGWTILLPFLAVAPLRAFERKDRREVTKGLALAVWLVILIASLRSGGDQWDNPRYRAAFASPQVALAAWVWFEHLRHPTPLLRRATVALVFILAWFLPWYLRRYTPIHWPVQDLFKTIFLGIASASLYFLWDWASESREKSHAENGPETRS